MRKTIYIEINAESVYKYPSHVRSRGLLPPRFILVVNSARAVVRVAALPDGSKKISANKQWELVRGAFPFGRTMDEKTHVFDGCAYQAADGGAMFLMVGLPLEVCEEIMRLGMAYLQEVRPGGGRENLRGIERRISRLETVETVLFRRFCMGAGRRLGAYRVMYPCESGVKMLTIVRGMPRGVYFLPAGMDVPAEIKEGALRRALADNASTEKITNTGGIMDTGEITNPEEIANTKEIKKTPEEIIFLTRSDWGVSWDETKIWLETFFVTEGICVSTEEF